jgi:UDP-N-acetylmuramate--alanine ligase
MMNLSLLKIMSRINHLHFIGIGGAGMGGIAEVLFHLGFKVTGSDINQNAMTKRLKSLGISIYGKHSAENISGANAVVRSSIIKDDNFEVIAAMHSHIPIVPRAMMLGELMRFRYGIAVAGTHGKTTTTSLITTIFAQAGCDPTFVIGGLLNSAGVNAKLGAGDHLIAEADESDASFLYLRPMISVVTNIDMDHMETYHGSFHELKQAFIDFIHTLPFYGLSVLCNEDQHVREILPKISRPVCTYGFSNASDIYADNIQQVATKNFFTVYRPRGHSPLEVTLNLAGEHNVLNALAAISIATEAGIPDSAILSGLESFSGVGRRLQIYGEYQTSQGKIMLIDDYGHHPQEISVTVKAIKKAFPERRLVMAYQPHRYTRTRDLMLDFATVLSSDIDTLLLFDVYSAGEAPIQHADSQTLLNLIKQNPRSLKHTHLISSTEIFSDTLKSVLKNNDILLIQGAGDIGSIASKLASNNLHDI